ncbi:MAG: hypothetical protein GF393_03125 [Armatimonadia bacterium]|nr:hypothetical protein [Armatimonadia bacterium]
MVISISMRRVVTLTLAAITSLASDASAYHSPRHGRFWQRDLLGYVDGMDTYQYMRSNPRRYVDPSGLLTASVLNAGLHSPAYLGFAPTKDSTVQGTLWWRPGSSGPIRVAVDGRQVATVSTKDARNYPTNPPSERCATKFGWDWDWLTRPRSGQYVGTIQYTMQGEAPINAIYIAERKALNDAKVIGNYHLAEGVGLSGMNLAVYGEYVQFALRSPLKVVNYNSRQCVWDTNLRTHLGWTYNPNASGKLSMGRIESEFGVTDNVTNVSRRTYRPDQLQPNRNPAGPLSPPPVPGYERITAYHGLADIWFIAGRHFRVTVHFGAWVQNPGGGITPGVANTMSITLSP